MADAAAEVFEGQLGKVFTNKTNERGDPFNYEFERYARRMLATGVSASACGEILKLHVQYILQGGKSDIRVPHKRWYRKQREAVGAEGWLWAMIKVAGCDRVLQHGCDETGIERVATFTQWVLVETGGETELITFEAGGVLIGSTADEVKAHVKTTWKRGGEAVELARAKLGDNADDLIPLRNGGVKL